MPEVAKNHFVKLYILSLFGLIGVLVCIGGGLIFIGDIIFGNITFMGEYSSLMELNPLVSLIIFVVCMVSAVID